MRAIRVAALALSAVMAAASPAASLSRDYLCFFNPASAELSPRCQLIAQEFIAWWHRTRHGDGRNWLDGSPLPAKEMRVEVHGHADAAEAAAGKAAVSGSRAEAIAAFLRLNGVPSEVVETVAFGADRPLYPAAGAEPQNRRVELYAR